ncbi:MAG: DoxX family protein [Planctomycetes bacterium]|nr:DoxX family protein [Planctomycetota bacterium]
MAQPQPIRGIDLVPLIIRITLGIVFIYHGYEKVFLGGHSSLSSLLTIKSAPYPSMLAWLAGFTEFFAGIAILIGLLSRFSALALACVMYVAITAFHLPNGFDIRNEGLGYEYCLVLLLAAFAIVLGGPGGLSLDRILLSRHKKTKK